MLVKLRTMSALVSADTAEAAMRELKVSQARVVLMVALHSFSRQQHCRSCDKSYSRYHTAPFGSDCRSCNTDATIEKSSR